MTTKEELAKEILIRKLVSTHVTIEQNDRWGTIFKERGRLSGDSSIELMKIFKIYFNVKYEDELEVKNQEIKQLKEELKLLNGGYEDSLNMQKCSNAGFMSKINELENQIANMYSEEDMKEFAIEVSNYDQHSQPIKSIEEHLDEYNKYRGDIIQKHK